MPKQTHYITTTLLLTLAAAPLLAGPPHWPSFRGPNASGVADGQNPPITWDVETGKNIAWKTALPGRSHSSPVVWGDRVFINGIERADETSTEAEVNRSGEVSDRAEHAWYVYALDIKSGRILWRRTATQGVPKSKRHRKTSYAATTPATDGEVVISLFGDEGLFAFDLDGNLLWKKDLGSIDVGPYHTAELQWGFASSPIIFKNMAIVLCEGRSQSFVAAYDVKTGDQKWRVDRKGVSSWSTPTVFQGGDRDELIINGKEIIAGYNPMTGEEFWRITSNSYNPIPAPVVTNDLIIVSSGYTPIKPIYAIKPGAIGDITLKEDQTTNRAILWSNMQDGPYIPTPLVYGDHLYVCSHRGVLSCFDLKTGERIYRERIGPRGGGYSASPIAADGRIYLTSESGDVHVVKAGPKYEHLGVNAMGEYLMATPAISQNMLIVRTEHFLYGIRR